MERLQALIAAVRRRWFAAVALRILGLAFIAAAVPVLAGLGVFWMVQPSDDLADTCRIVSARKGTKVG